MKARLADARQGARWLAGGWRLVRAAPIAWAGALLAGFALLLVLGRLSLIGAPLFVVLTPAMWAALMAVARAVAGGGGEPPAAFARTLARHARPLAALGVVYLAANVASIAATIPFGEGLLAAWVFQGKAPPREQVESAAFLADVGLSLVFYAPAMLAYWFAPMLVVWHGTGAAKALFFSLTACLFNWRAFCAYAVTAVLLFFALFASLSLAASLLVAASGAPPNAALVVILPAFGLFLAVLVASVYASYCDVLDTGANGKSPTIPA